MREIKYKAWDKIKKEMIYSDHEGGLRQFFDYIDNPNPIANEIEFMEFTGLEDKNGKEIFEGDILKKHYYAYSREPKNNNYGIVRQEKGTCNLEFVWNFEARYEGEKYWDENILSLKRACEYEVVGNIFENPELLLKENNK